MRACVCVRACVWAWSAVLFCAVLQHKASGAEEQRNRGGRRERRRERREGGGREEGERREGGGREEGRQKRISFGKRERKRGGMGNRVIVRLTMFFR